MGLSIHIFKTIIANCKAPRKLSCEEVNARRTVLKKADFSPKTSSALMAVLNIREQ